MKKQIAVGNLIVEYYQKISDIERHSGSGDGPIRPQISHRKK